MARPFAVEGETFPGVTDAREAACKCDISSLRTRQRIHGERLGRLVDGSERVLCKKMQDVGQQQFLVLLLMMATQFNELRGGGRGKTSG